MTGVGVTTSAPDCGGGRAVVNETSLRERSKVRRRAAIQEAALRLFATQGYEATTIAQVAQQAEVSPRTVSLYFTSKLELALSYTAAASRRYSDAFARARPGDGTVDVIARWVEEEFREHGAWRALHRSMIHANPALRGAETPETLRARRSSRTFLTAELGRAPDDPVVVLVAGAVDGVLTALLDLPPELDAGEAVGVATRMLAAVVDAVQQRSDPTPGLRP